MNALYTDSFLHTAVLGLSTCKLSDSQLMTGIKCWFVSHLARQYSVVFNKAQLSALIGSQWNYRIVCCPQHMCLSIDSAVCLHSAAGRSSRWQSHFTGSRLQTCSSWRVCLSWLPCPLNNSKLSWYFMSQCQYSYAKLRQPDSEVKNLYFNQAEAFYQFSCMILCWVVTKRDAFRIDAFDQWCLWKLLGIKWYQPRVELWGETDNWAHLLAIVQVRRFSLFIHIAWMPYETDTKKILTASPLEN